MYELNLPTFDFRLKKENSVVFIFDVIRKKFVKLTPEEWVRQHVVHFLLEQKHYPASLMNVEVGMEIQTMRRRADIVCYESDGGVRLITECKAPEVKITQTVFEQIAQYNMCLKAKYLLVTNGLEHFVCEINAEQKTYTFLQDIPPYKTA
ncbi:MAG: type I restriction enzyme HsdR N-terminal domain-containing protein [Bacteroidales bacterium]|jgi:predicted type IV restriction endonuclease|nr:type I restriction enzyme HsdR N-terminal domain-containing protein [Bacteroidales bacterium]MBR4115599.1 type I restriction enzyme HsdR N-terminal domain-containing protein [Bacteroidales bacterium]